MFIDFRDLESKSDIQADLCIIGAGAAGISIARTFIDTPVSVCVLESGGFDHDDEIQSLYDVVNTGINTRSCRRRYFGGTTNDWAGQCRPLSRLDFESRSWISYSGWPISLPDLVPYYGRAHELLELGPYEYDVERLSDDPFIFPRFDATKLDVCFWRMCGASTMRFGNVFREQLESADNVRVYLHANVEKLAPYVSGEGIESVAIRTLDGKEGTVKARVFILACGGIENARVLLLSDDLHPQGVGNDNDCVGRFFMQHPHCRTGGVMVNSSDLASFLNNFRHEKTRVRAGIAASPAAQQNHQMLNCSHTISVKRGETGYRAAQQMIRSARNRRMPDDVAEKLWRVISDIDSVCRGTYARIMDEHYLDASNIENAWLYARSEQAPNPDSRIMLDETLDALGQRRTVINWQLTDIDKRTVRQHCQFIGEEFGRLALGRIQMPDWLLSPDSQWPTDLYGGCHHMGTTRMSASPKNGVVNSNCRVHSVDNLYVAGSSVFTTSGYANPTLTIVALALRLADHLAEALRA